MNCSICNQNVVYVYFNNLFFLLTVSVFQDNIKTLNIALVECYLKSDSLTKRDNPLGSK